MRAHVLTIDRLTACFFVCTCVHAQVMIIFTDAGSGYVRASPSLAAKYSSGLYFHTAYYNNAANQLTEMVPADRMIAQWTAFNNASARHTLMVNNPSDLRPVPMTTDLVFKLAWDPSPFTAYPDANASAMAFYTNWCVFNLAPLTYRVKKVLCLVNYW